jgi:uncharacterized protein YegL
MVMSDNVIDELQAEKQNRIPIYLVVDTSLSMDEDGKIQAANEMVPKVIDTCIDNPLVDQAALFSLIEFSHDARMVVPLTKGSEMDPHTLTTSPDTSYANVFRLLRNQLESDYQRQKSLGFTLYRPCVVFITDGEPFCDPAEREAAFAQLTDPSFARRPNMSVFGVGSDVSRDTLKRYVAGHGVAVETRKEADAAEALKAMIGKLMSSVVSSTTAGAVDPEDPVPVGVAIEEDDESLQVVGGDPRR